MAKEIERKFLIDPSLLPEGIQSRHIQQGYLSHDVNKVVRVRRYGEEGFITVKSKTNSISRDEFEYAIPLKDVGELLALCSKGVIEKKRFIVTFEGKQWEVDQFLGENEGLWLAEIELKAEEEEFKRPSWLKEEVSQDNRYFNSYLSGNPYKYW